ncbi:MAG TPA: GNAT family N-acetyltransferase [Tepidisphaeraceae bacterium]|jgi:GNAT superfamily N-acetyltransferase
MPLDLTQLIVRDALEEDLPALDRLRPFGVVHADRIRTAHPERARYLVADLDDEIVGTVMLYFRADSGWDRASQMPLLMDLFVPERFRSQGIGTALIAAVEQFCLIKGLGHLYLRVDPERNPRAFNLYKRLGFQALQSKPYEDAYQLVDSSGKVHEAVEHVVDMRKWLA